MHLGFQWTPKPNPKANIELAFQNRSGPQLAGAGGEPRPAPMAQEEERGADSTASHRMTQFREALAGRTHAQKLPGQPFPHPAAPTLRTQQKHQ